MEDSDKFFTLICECDMEYCPAESKACPDCQKSQGKGLKFNVDSFLERIYELQFQNKKDDCLDIICDAFFNLWDRFDIMTEILQKIDLTKISTAVMVTLLTNTFKFSSRLPEHDIFFQKVKNEYIKLGKSEEEIKKIIGGLENDKGHWETMSALGATGIMWGPKP